MRSPADLDFAAWGQLPARLPAGPRGGRHRTRRSATCARGIRTSRLFTTISTAPAGADASGSWSSSRGRSTGRRGIRLRCRGCSGSGRGKLSRTARRRSPGSVGGRPRSGRSRCTRVCCVPTAGRPPGLAEVTRVAREIEHLPEIGAGRSRCALVFDYPSAWAWEAQPHGADFDYFALCFDFLLRDA